MNQSTFNNDLFTLMNATIYWKGAYDKAIKEEDLKTKMILGDKIDQNLGILRTLLADQNFWYTLAS